jgi:selenocysteine lyase/cysteine desulfurase
MGQNPPPSTEARFYTPAMNDAAEIDLERVRSDTPGCAEVVHLNNCGSALPPQPVVDAMIDYLRLESMVGGYEAAGEMADGLDRVYDAGAELLNCDRDELAFVDGASEGWWRALLSVPFTEGDRVLIGRTEYTSNVYALIQLAERGITVDVVPDDSDGQIDLSALEAMLDERVKLVALTTIAMTNGLVNPTEQVGSLAKAAGAYFLVDACQAVGQIPVDVERFQCDFLSFTGRKFVRGPRGSGMLYVRRAVFDELLPPVFIDGRSADWTTDTTYELQPSAQRFEFFERSYASKLGLGVAFDYALSLGMEAIEARVVGLAERLRAGLDTIEGVTVRDTGVRRCGIVTFDVAGRDQAEVSAELRTRGIQTGSLTLANSRYDLGLRGVESLVRAGVHYYNSEAEIDRLTAEVADLARR